MAEITDELAAATIVMLRAVRSNLSSSPLLLSRKQLVHKIMTTNNFLSDLEDQWTIWEGDRIRSQSSSPSPSPSPSPGDEGSSTTLLLGDLKTPSSATPSVDDSTWNKPSDGK